MKNSITRLLAITLCFNICMPSSAAAASYDNAFIRFLEADVVCKMAGETCTDDAECCG